MMCRVLNVSRSSYYRWLKDPVGKRKRKSMKLSREIKMHISKPRDAMAAPGWLRLQASESMFPEQPSARHMKKMGLRSKLSKKLG